MRYDPDTNSTGTQTPTINNPATAPAPARPSGLKKVTFGAIKEKKTTTKTVYPIIPDPDGELYRLAKLIKQQSQELESIEGALEANKASLKRLALPAYFTMHQGKTDVPSSVSIPTTEGEVLVTFSSRYKKIAEESVSALLGEDFMAQWFKQTFEVKIAGDKLASVDPANPDRNPAQEFIDALQALIAQHNAEAAATFTQAILPTKEFHEKRHTLLTSDKNVAVDSCCPMIVMVKTKGRDSTE